MEWRPGLSNDFNYSQETTPGSYFYYSEDSNWTLYKRFNMMSISSYAHFTHLPQQQHFETNRRFVQPQPYQRRHAEIPPHGYRERNRPGLTFSDDGGALIDGLNAVHLLSQPMRPAAIRNHWTSWTRYPILPIGNYYRRRQWYPSIDKIKNYDKYINEMVSDPDPSKYTPPGPGFNAAGPSQITTPAPFQFTAPGPSTSTSCQQIPAHVQLRKSKSARLRERRATRRAVRKAKRQAAREAEQRAELAALYPYCPWPPVSPPTALDAQEQTYYESYDVQGLGAHGETQPFEGGQSDSEVQMMAQLDINDVGEPRQTNK